MNDNKLLEKILLELTEIKQENIELKAEVKRLNEIINKDSSNSSKPPSTDDGFKDTKKPSSTSKTKKTRGGQKGSTSYNLKKVDNPDHIKILDVKSCKNCNHNLEDVDSKLISTKQLFDIPQIKIEVTEFQLYSKTCSCCGSINKPDYPSNLTSYVQYGDNIKTLIVYLNTYQMLPYERISEFLEDFISHKISSGTIYNMLNCFYKKIEPFENNIKDLLLKSKVIHIDETGTRVKDKLHWTHTVSTSLLTYYMIHQKRGKDAIDEMAILPTYDGIAVHDHWKPYNNYNCTHSYCNAHHLRELIGIVQNEEVRWATDMHSLLTNMNKYIYKLKKNNKISPSKGKIQHYYQQYDNICQSALKFYPPPDKPPTTKRKQKQSKSKNLLDRLIAYKDETLRFFINLLVPFTNNLAERDLRMIKVKEKISGCFASFKGAKIFNRIRSYISTVKKNKRSVFNELINALSGKYYVPSLVEC
jgi:transposase